MSENGEIYTAGKNFTLPPAVTAWTNSTSDPDKIFAKYRYSLGGTFQRQNLWQRNID